jgi:hypothetical protein
MSDEFYFGALLLVIGLAFAWYVNDGIGGLFKRKDRKTPPAIRPPGVRYAGAVFGTMLIANIAVLQTWPGQSWYILGAVAALVIADAILWRQRRPQGRDAFVVITSGICLVAGILDIKDHPRGSLVVFVIGALIGLAIVAVKKRQRQDAPAQ